jgi:lycopene cyclase domain-containing protein
VDRFQYLLLLGLCVAGTLPLEWAFRARVYRRFATVLRALWLPVVVFCAWDAVAIARGDWSFNQRYVTGWSLPFDVPVEELLFFVVIPLCSLLTLESCRQILEARRA